METTEEQMLLIARALRWWQGHCPLEWTAKQHLENPTINAHGSQFDTDLAEACGPVYAALYPEEAK